MPPSRRHVLAGAGAVLAGGGCGPSPAAGFRPQASPADAGLDAALMAQAREALAALPGFHSLVVARDGAELVAERMRGPGLDTPVNIKSASKSVLSAVVGAAIERGVLTGLDQRIAPVLAADLPPDPDPRLNRITVDHLLSMRAGLERTSGENYGAWISSPNWVRYALARPFEDEPGGRMLYSTGSSHLMSAVLTRASGRSTLDLAREWLAGPLGVDLPAWPRDPQGIHFGGNDMRMSPRALVRFGELYRNEGVVEGRRVLMADWIAESWRVRGRSQWSGQGYGLGWFVKEVQGHPVHFAWGYGGQMVFVAPELALTVVMTSDASPRPRSESHLGQLHHVLDTMIVPAARRGA